MSDVDYVRDSMAAALRHNEALLLANLWRAHKHTASSWAPGAFEPFECFRRLALLGCGAVEFEAPDMDAVAATLRGEEVEL